MEETEVDTWLTDIHFMDVYPKLGNFTSTIIEGLHTLVVEGKLAMIKILNYNDYLVSTFHPNPPSDAKDDARNLDTLFKQSPHNQHPSSSDPNLIKSMDDETRDSYYGENTNAFQRHLHGDYCCSQSKHKEALQEPTTEDPVIQDPNLASLAAVAEKKQKENALANKNCRGGFAKKLRGKSVIAVKETRNGRISVEILLLCNDRWMNPNNRIFIEYWQANIDFRLTIDVGKIVGYMTKYVNKTKTNNNARSLNILFSMLKKSCVESPSTEATLKRMMSKVS